jgi:pyridoxal phosphate enzyme (YggS family)
VIGVTENLALISDLLRKSAIEANRDPVDVRLLAVSKKQPLENFVQEGVDKIEAMAETDLTWHFIGHLQSNKTRVVAEYFDWVHTIDKLKTARRLSAQRPAGLPPLNVCLQVNVDLEASKSGVAPDALPELAAACTELPGIRLRGLMCLPAIRDKFEDQRVPFARLRELASALRADGIDMDTLSMGMTADYRAAIFERIGTALFGERT